MKDEETFLEYELPKVYNISRQEILLLISFLKSGRILLIFSEMNHHVVSIMMVK